VASTTEMRRPIKRFVADPVAAPRRLPYTSTRKRSDLVVAMEPGMHMTRQDDCRPSFRAITASGMETVGGGGGILSRLFIGSKQEQQQTKRKNKSLCGFHRNAAADRTVVAAPVAAPRRLPHTSTRFIRFRHSTFTRHHARDCVPATAKTYYVSTDIPPTRIQVDLPILVATAESKKKENSLF
jgi:hypothetical protein